MAEVVDLASRRSWDEIETVRQRFESQHWYERSVVRLEQPVVWAALEEAASDPARARHRDKLEQRMLAEAYGGTAHLLVEDAVAWGRLLPRTVDLKQSPWRQVSAAEMDELRAVIDYWRMSGGREAPPAGKVARPPVPAERGSRGPQYEMFGDSAREERPFACWKGQPHGHKTGARSSRGGAEARYRHDIMEPYW